MAHNRFREAAVRSVGDGNPSRARSAVPIPGRQTSVRPHQDQRTPPRRGIGMDGPDAPTPEFELPEGWGPVLDALVVAPIAWQSPGQVAEALAAGVEETTEVLCRMDVEGWIAVWDGEAGPLVTLTPLAAERMRVVLVEYGADETPRWARVGDPV